MRARFKQNAFTLFELLCVLSIVCLIVMLTDVGLFSLLQKQNTQSAAQSFFTDLQFARSEAIKRNHQVHICPSCDAKQCANEWSGTYLIFVKNKENQNQDIDILRVNHFSKNLNVEHSNHPLISFNGDGTCLTRATLSLRQGTHIQKVVIYDSGRARLETVS